MRRSALITMLVAAILAGLALVSPTSASASAPRISAPVTTVSASSVAARATPSVTRKCTTSGSAGLIDSMFVVRTYVGHGVWKYRITRSPNRNTTVHVGEFYHYVDHTAIMVQHYNGLKMIHKVTNPPNAIIILSRSSDDYFHISYRVTDHANLNFLAGCNTLPAS